MERIKLLTKEQASESAQKALDAITQGGRVINIFKAMSNSAVALKTFSGIAGALKESTVSPEILERIGLQMAAINGCEYCTAAHSYSAKNVISEDEILNARKGKSSDAKAQAALDFAGSVMKNAGKVSDEEFAKIKQAGFSDGEILEIVTVVTLNFFTNAINNVSQTKVDFPKP